MSASAHGAKRVRRPIARVHLRIENASSSASFARPAPLDDLNGPM